MKDLDALLEKAKAVNDREPTTSIQWVDKGSASRALLPDLLDALTSLLEENRRLQSERDQFENLLMDAKEERDMEKAKDRMLSTEPVPDDPEEIDRRLEEMQGK
jgi:uncharacterized protein YlxW (UPF0749 family)